jgi:para-nitrobenzyl esterase
LNVWATAAGSARRPVFVYLYGGGFNEGAGSDCGLRRRGAGEEGDSSSSRINYRVGVFGFLAHPDLAAE